MIKSKFLKIKKWIDLNEAANRLSVSLEEKITALDLLELGLDKELKISIKLPYSNKYVVREAWLKRALWSEQLESCFQLMQIANGENELKKGSKEYQLGLSEYIHAEFQKYIKKRLQKSVDKKILTLDYFINEMEYEYWDYSEEVFYLDENIFELEMVGAEVIDIKTMIEVNKNREPVEMYNLDGVFIKSISGKIYNLMERFSNEDIKSFQEDHQEVKSDNYLNQRYYFPADGLPVYTEFGVRTEHLMEFESKIHLDNNSYSSDDLLYIMGGVLNNVTSKAKKWTQGEMAISLSEKGIKNLGERKINEIFSIANKEYKKIN